MISANELRVGNWVLNQHGEWQKIFNINDDGMKIHNRVTVQYSCNPIPLTPELLKKCGFSAIGDSKDYRKKNLVIHSRVRGWVVNRNIAPIKSLHQLQNLYFAMNQKEMEVKF